MLTWAIGILISVVAGIIPGCGARLAATPARR